MLWCGRVGDAEEVVGAILVVEDDEDVRESLAAILEDAGHVVTTAADGNKALELLRGGLRPRLILLDLMMPVLDGFEFRIEQWRDPGLSTIPVVVITAGWYPEDKAAALRPDGYITKPIRVDALLEMISRFP
jgi:CheY-like chemotaxis protein